MKKNINILSVCSLAFVLSFMCVSCKKGGNAMYGSWQLMEFCYGADCSNVTDHDIVQIWQFNEDVVNCDESKTIHLGRQFQEGIMDNEILWFFSKNNDTLFTSNKMGEDADTFLVQRLDKDTMLLSSLMNNILVQQLFVKTE